MNNNTLPCLGICAFLLFQLSACTSVPAIKAESATTEFQGPVTPVQIVEDFAQEFREKMMVDPLTRKSRETPNIEDPSFSNSIGIDTPKADLDGIANGPADDLWQHLRNSFSLDKSSKSDVRVINFERWYSKHPKYFERLGERAYWLMPYILAELEQRGMPAEIALLPAVESAFRHDATSPSKAAGLWQIMPATGRRFGLRQDWWMDGRRDMVHSTRAALDYLEYLSREFNDDWLLAFAAYNAGEGTIRREIRRNLGANIPTDYWSLSLRKETAEYVPRLIAIRNIIENPEKYGIALKPIPNKQTLVVIDARVQTDLNVAASLIACSSGELHALNLGYKRGVTPPTGPHNIVVPAEQADLLLSSLDKLSHQQRMQWVRHEVRKGEYLGRIARKYGVTVDSIIAVNHLQSKLIHPGQELKMPVSTAIDQVAIAFSDAANFQEGDKMYTIQFGDSLWKISQNIGTSLSKLLNWNGMTNNSLLHPGQQLVVGRSTGT